MAFYGNYKPNTTMNIPYEVLQRVNTFLDEHSGIFLNNKRQDSRNILIEKSLIFVMDNYEDIKDKLGLPTVAA